MLALIIARTFVGLVVDQRSGGLGPLWVGGVQRRLAQGGQAFVLELLLIEES